MEGTVMPETRGLGKGIRALIPEGSPLPKEGVSRVKIEAIRQNRYQPRQKFNQAKIQELADSIRESGLIYPLLVRKSDESGEFGEVSWKQGAFEENKGTKR